LYALAPLADWLESYPGSAEVEDVFEHSILERHGARLEAVERAHRGSLTYGEAVSVTRRLADGDVLEFADRRLRVLHRPGHSPYDTVLHDEQRGLLLGADHVLAWPSTPIMAPPVDASARNGRPRAFHDYLGSLRATSALALEVILPGHGNVLEDPAATIAKRLERYARITAQTADTVDADPRSAAAIATELKGALPRQAAFFVLCEVLGHLDELIDAGAVAEYVDAGGVARFVAT
jgi:glyoxylase-like metal-dependent hydrolase (beta-lactamase superfamily II)